MAKFKTITEIEKEQKPKMKSPNPNKIVEADIKKGILKILKKENII